MRMVLSQETLGIALVIMLLTLLVTATMDTMK